MQSKRQFYSLISGYNLIFRSSCPYFIFDVNKVVQEQMLQKDAFGDNFLRREENLRVVILGVSYLFRKP